MAHDTDKSQDRRGSGASRRVRATPAAHRRASKLYDRREDLARVLPLWPHELEDTTLQGRAKVLDKLSSLLRAERRRGLAGHWTYDLARHAELLRLYRLELAASRRTRCESGGPPHSA